MASVNRVKPMLIPPMDGFASRGCTVAEARYAKWKGGGGVSRVVGWWYAIIFRCL